jgi:hypothetical protein
MDIERMEFANVTGCKFCGALASGGCGKEIAGWQLKWKSITY